MARGLIVVVFAACTSTPQDRPEGTPSPPPATTCPATRPAPDVTCAANDATRCTYDEWSCACTALNNAWTWMCSSCIAPDTTKPCTPGAHCEQHNWERDEYYSCKADGTWICNSSSSNNAACAGLPRR